MTNLQALDRSYSEYSFTEASEEMQRPEYREGFPRHRGGGETFPVFPAHA